MKNTWYVRISISALDWTNLQITLVFQFGLYYTGYGKLNWKLLYWWQLSLKWIKFTEQNIKKCRMLASVDNGPIWPVLYMKAN